MKAIKENKNYTYQINGSKFISYCFYVEKVDEIKYHLLKIENEHKKAKHICFAYKIQDNFKFNDDGEPIGTAGKKILDVINISNLDNILIVVVRYMGNTKLGAKLLSRSYYASAFEIVNDSINITELFECNIYNIITTNELLNDVLKNLKNEKIIDKKINNNEWIITTTINESIKFMFKNATHLGKKFFRK